MIEQITISNHLLPSVLQNFPGIKIIKTQKTHIKTYKKHQKSILPGHCIFFHMAQLPKFSMDVFISLTNYVNKLHGALHYLWYWATGLQMKAGKTDRVKCPSWEERDE